MLNYIENGYQYKSKIDLRIGGNNMKKVHGSYMQTSDAMNAVEELKAEGYTRDQIRVVSVKDCGNDCSVDPKIDQTNKENVKDDRTLWQKLKDIYTYSDYKTDYWNTYVAEDEILSTYQTNLENGEILVLVDADKIL